MYIIVVELGFASFGGLAACRSQVIILRHLQVMPKNRCFLSRIGDSGGNGDGIFLRLREKACSLLDLRDSFHFGPSLRQRVGGVPSWGEDVVAADPHQGPSNPTLLLD